MTPEIQPDVLILDGYVDEPGLLGVPPYLAPEPRRLAGLCEEKKLRWKYITAGQYRQEGLPDAQNILLYGGVTVPGNYLGGRPLSPQEAEKIAAGHPNVFVGGPLASHPLLNKTPSTNKDLCAYFLTHLEGELESRRATADESERWLIKGAEVVKKHPCYPEPLLAEISTYRGCVRYMCGGCSFCSEPLYGKPDFREQRDIIAEIKQLYDLGIRHFRLGGQSCIISYKCKNLGKTEKPEPDPGQIEKLFAGINRECPEIKVLHVDNANPAIIAAHPVPAEEIIKILAEKTTAGNILALGMESADPDVIKANNLNATPEEVEESVRLINRHGKKRGDNGMPMLLPGLNFLAGLKGETKKTYELNLDFLRRLRKKNYWLRRINIRQVLSHRSQFDSDLHSGFKKFKKQVREEIDRPLLEEMFPVGTLLRNVYMEKRDGDVTFGRQTGTYPLLVGVKYPLELDRFYDIKVTEHGYRSISGVHHPLKFQDASVRQLRALPGLGSKRASKIFVALPQTPDEFRNLISDPKAAQKALEFLQF